MIRHYKTILPDCHDERVRILVLYTLELLPCLFKSIGEKHIAAQVTVKDQTEKQKNRFNR